MPAEDAQLKPRPQVQGRPITGREGTPELLEKAFQAFVGRELRNAYQILRRMIQEDHTVVCTLSGAMTPADLGTTCLIPLIQAGIVDVLSTTGANIYHDLQRLLSGQFYAIDPQTQADDRRLRREGYTRIYDLVFPEADLYRTDEFIRKLLQRPAFQKPLTTPQFHDLLGKYAAQLERQHHRDPAQSRSLLVQAHLHRVPVFCGAPQDSSIHLNVAWLKRVLGEDFKFTVDLETDIHEFAAYHLLAKREGSRRLSVLILGGGVPKNYALQPEPYLSQICGLDAGGYDCDVQICDAHVQNGSLSSCTAGEAHTWGKTSDQYATNSQYVFADVTAVTPLLVHALLQEGLQKTPRRLLDRRDEALTRLDEALAQVKSP